MDQTYISQQNFLKAAIKMLGGQNVMADKVGRSQQTISYWLKSKKGIVPAEIAVSIEKATGGRITRVDLRPDLFGDVSHGAHSFSNANLSHLENVGKIPAPKSPSTNGQL